MWCVYLKIGGSRKDISQNKGGVAGPDTPKIQALPEWGGSDPCLDFCEGFVHMH